MPTLDDKIQAINDTASAAYNAARNNPDITPDARLRRIAKTYITQRDALAAVQGDNTAAEKTEADALSYSLYGLPAGADSLSYRDALQRVQSIDLFQNPRGEDELRDLLEQGRLTRDDLLTRAVLKVAYDNRLADTINLWISENPTKAADAERLWDLQTAFTTQGAFVNAGRFFAAKQTEISGMPDYQIEALAALAPQSVA